jgi:hypothetical protein
MADYGLWLYVKFASGGSDATREVEQDHMVEPTRMAKPTYTVREGDGGWYQVAQKLTRERGYRIDWRELQRLNPQYVRAKDWLYGNGTEVLTLPPRPGTPPADMGGKAELKDNPPKVANGSDSGEPKPSILLVNKGYNTPWWAVWQWGKIWEMPATGIWWAGHNISANPAASYYFPQGSDAKPDKGDALFMLDGFLPVGLDKYRVGDLRRSGRFIKAPLSEGQPIVADMEFTWSVYMSPD